MIKIYVKINDLKINYINVGEGNNVLILPGWGTTISTYKTLIDSISTYSKVYTLDMPGCGNSEEPLSAWNLDSYIEFINAFIEKESIKELDIIGHSNGGRIIIKGIASQKFKCKINKVILIGSAGIKHKNKILNVKVKLFKLLKAICSFKLIKKLFPDLINKLKNKFGSEDYKNASPIMKQTMVNLINEDLREYLPSMNVPTLLIWGEKDTATPIEDAMLMEKLIPDSGLVKIKDCSHFVFLENSNYVNRIIQTFLN